ncbi:MAG: Fic family protein, partial [Candidatus Thermoplasmatota archaeon]|nr:Fic family protein [Candidatus Thermoplasmatota archaeon]
MISNNYLTIKMILDLKDDDLTSEMILEIHDSMTSGTLENGRFEGRYRDNNEIVVMDNTTGEVVHCPPDHERLSELIRDLCLFVNTRHDGKEGRDFIHPIIKASIIHFLIGYLHPFEDGNGRCARALFYWFMLKSDYRLMEYMSISRTIKASPSGYARAYLFSEKDENDIGYFIMFKTRVIEKALDDLISYIERNTTRKNNIPFSTALAKCGFNNRQAYILEKMKENENRTFTIKEVRNIFNVVHQTARTDLQDLIDRKLIEREQAGRRFIYFTSGKFKKKLECYLNK